MESFLNKVMKLGSVNMPTETNILQPNLDNEVYEEPDDQYNTIATATKPKEDGQGLSAFVSKTKRGHSISNIPGPGSYNSEYKHVVSKNTPANFGSSQERITNVIRNDVNLPFNDPSYIEVPPVGHYGQPRLKTQLNRIKSLKQTLPSKNNYQSKIVIKGGRATRKGFNSTTKRDVAKLKSTLGEAPGPGAYDLSFKDVIKMIDQKLAIRYQISPFGSGKSRFDARNKTIDVINNNNQSLQNNPGFKIRDKHAASDILNEHYKNKEKYRNSYTYTSSVARFRNHTVNTKSQSNVKKDLQPDFMLVNESKAKEELKYDNLGQTSSVAELNRNSISPFDSRTPRFPQKRDPNSNFDHIIPLYFE